MVERFLTNRNSQTFRFARDFPLLESTFIGAKMYYIKHPDLIFITQCQNGTEASNKLIP